MHIAYHAIFRLVCNIYAGYAILKYSMLYMYLINA